MMKHKLIRAVSLGIFLFGTTGIVVSGKASAAEAPAGTSSTTLSNDSIAAVNGQQILASDVLSMLLRDTSVVNPVINRLIDDSLIEQEAKRQGVVATADEIQGRKEQLMSLNRLTKLDDILRRHHETMADLEHDIRVWIETVKLLTPNAKQPKMVQIRHILIRITPTGQTAPKTFVSHTETEALAIARNIQNKIKKGEKFDDLVKEYSEDVSTKENGGDLGVVYDDGPFEPSLLMAALSLTKPGQIADAPVKSSVGYHLIQAVRTGEQHLASQNASYANAAIVFRARLVTDAQTQAFILGLRTKAKIVNHYMGE